MTIELSNKLVDKYPELCVDYLGDVNKTCFHWGFEFGDGWYDLIDETLSKIDNIRHVSGINIKIAQAKAKFGSLRLYLDIGETDDINYKQYVNAIHNIVDEAEIRSEGINQYLKDRSWG